MADRQGGRMRATSKGAVSRQQILRAAAEVAAEHGYAGTTIARVTQRCGLPASSVYWHFADKDELLVEVVNHSHEVWRAEQLPHRPPPVDVSLAEGLRPALGPVLRGLLDSPDFLRIGLMLLLEERGEEVPARTRFLELRESMHADLRAWFGLALRRTPAAGDETLPGLLAELVMTGAEGFYVLSRSGLEVDPDAFLETLLAVVETTVRDAGTSTASDRSPAG